MKWHKCSLRKHFFVLFFFSRAFLHPKSHRQHNKKDYPSFFTTLWLRICFNLINSQMCCFFFVVNSWIEWTTKLTDSFKVFLKYLNLIQPEKIYWCWYKLNFCEFILFSCAKNKLLIMFLFVLWVLLMLQQHASTNRVFWQHRTQL